MLMSRMMRSLGACVDFTHGSVEGLPSLDLFGGLVGPLLSHHLVHQMHHAGRAGRVRALSHTQHTENAGGGGGGGGVRAYVCVWCCGGVRTCVYVHAGVMYVCAYVCVCGVVLWGCTYMRG